MSAVVEAVKDPHARPRLRGRIHQYAVGVAAVCGVVLCAVAATRSGALAFGACLIYSVTICGLFGTSALYHRRVWGPRGYAVMKRLDHSMIFLFIAGTYTPFSLLLLDRPTATWVLAVVWGGAVLGVALKMAWPRAPRWLSVPLYIVLGWTAAFVFPDLWRGGGTAPLVLLLAGGVLYSAGAVCYALKRPNPWPRTFGHHEFFHAATVVAALCHYIGVYFAVFAS
jgi:hemolysin III